jgi:hypothetical protein
MNSTVTLTQSQLIEFLLNVATIRPVFIWGAPGIGKSALVEAFAKSVGLPCVSLLGSQLAPEDIIGVPQIIDGKSRFCPPRLIAKEEPYCLFLDELNSCSHEVQKSFYSLIHEKRIAEYILPKGSIVIGAGNRSQDSAIVKPISSALINRMVHVHLKVSHRDWLNWAHQTNIHPWVIEYIQNRSDHLWSQPPKHEEPFSTPRSWHMVSDALHSFGEGIHDELLSSMLYGCLTPHHAGQFKAFIKQIRNKYALSAILKGEIHWPTKPEDRDLLYFLAQSFRSHLSKELPEEQTAIRPHHRELAHNAKGLLKELASINFEVAQMVVSEGEDNANLPSWLLVEIVRDLPRLIAKKDEQKT